MIRARRPPRRPQTLGAGKADENDIPPDPKSSINIMKVKPAEKQRCLLTDIDASRLSSLIAGHPAGRSTALLLQAIRQQMSMPSSYEYTKTAIEWVVDNDILMLKLRKNSVLCRILQSDVVESREQMARLVNTIASFTKGRNYLTGHQRSILPCLVAVLRGRRLPSSTFDQLVATIEKLSIRSSIQRDLLQCGMLEWLVHLLENRCSQYALEYGSAIAINISMNSASSSLQTRFADSIAAAACNVLNKDGHGQSCSLINNLIFTWLTCSRIRVRAKETKLLDAIKSRLNRRNCPLCSLHVPYMIAVICGEAEAIKVPQPPNDHDTDMAGDCCEHEVDSMDPLRPSSHELSGARLLLRRAHRENTEEQTPVPGQVPRHNNGVVTKNSKQKEPRLGTAASTHTFIVETERRKPIVVPTGLTEGATEYKKLMDVRAKEEEKQRKEKEKEEKEAAEKAARTRKPPVPKREISINTEKSGSNLIKKTSPKQSIERISFVHTSSSNGRHTPQTGPAETFIIEHENDTPENYAEIFAARPKIARTPEHHRTFF